MSACEALADVQYMHQEGLTLAKNGSSKLSDDTSVAAVSWHIAMPVAGAIHSIRSGTDFVRRLKGWLGTGSLK